MKAVLWLILAIIVFIGGWYYFMEPKKTVEVVSATYTNNAKDLITVSDPLPGGTVAQTFTVSGTARGYWFFEGSFPAEVRDASGAVIGTGLGSSVEEWMTENFIPFTVPITLVAPYTGPATLVLKKDNPSALPENDASVSIPIILQ